MENQKWIIKELKKQFAFEGYVLNGWEEGDDEDIHYFDTLLEDELIEIKVVTDKKGRFTNFEIWQRYEGFEDWNYLGNWEAFI